MGSDLRYRSAIDLATAVRNGGASPVEAVETCLDQIESRDPAVNAFITVTPERAREAARAAEAAVERGDDLGPLHGVPVAIKDLTPVAGVRFTLGAKPLADNVAEASGTAVERLEAAGAIVVGKTNTPEFGLKVKTDNRLVGPTSTPFSIGQNAGGSSGGSAAAVAAGMVPLALGSDAGGSVRIPSAFCGVVGVKPSFGRIPFDSRPNAFSTHTPFTHHGVHARSVADAALMLSVLSGPHPRDPFTLPEDDVELVESADCPVDALRVAYSPDLGVFPIDPAVRSVVEEAVERFESAVATVDEVEVAFGHTLDELVQDGSMTQWNVETAAAAENLRETFGLDVTGEHRDELPSAMVEMVEAGRRTDAVTYRQADLMRTDVYDAVQDVFDEYDLLACPVTTVPPFSNDVLGPETVDGVPVDPLAGWFLTFPFNLTGHPAASVPAGFTDDGLPVGLQLVAPRFADDTLLAASAALERVRPWAEAYHRAAG